MALIYRTQQLQTEFWANSGSPQDIQNAVDEAIASGGGNVFVPFGDFVFNPNDAPSGQGVQSIGSVNIFGAGKDKTILRQTRRVNGSIPMFTVDGSNDKPSRISGFTGIAYIPDPIDENSAGGVFTYNCKNFRVDHCSFKDFDAFGVRAYQETVAIKREDSEYQYYWNWGVVDHCDFDLPYKDVSGTGLDRGYGVHVVGPGRRDAWLYNLSDILGKNPVDNPPKCALYQWNAGTGKYDLVDAYGGKQFRWLVYIEDCTFSRWRHAIVGADCAFYVSRHNTFEKPRPDWGGENDIHGAGDISWWGGRGAEVYSNTIIGDQGYGCTAIDYRSGGGAVFGNTMITCEYGVGLSHDATQVVCYVRDLWIWSNTFQNVPTPIHDYWGNTYTEEVDYFLRMRPEYTPYTYPHPLTLEEVPKTPWTGQLEEATYKISVPAQVQVGIDIYNFKQWEDGSTNPVRTVNLTTDTTITATYELIQLLKYTLVINAVTGGTTEPALGAHEYEAGTIVTVTAVPASKDYVFKRFELDGEVKLQNPINVGMDADHTLLAVFEPAAPPISPSIAFLFLLTLLGSIGVVAVAKKGGE